MSTSTLPTPLVSIDWLAQNLEHPQLIILDASMPKAGTNGTSDVRMAIPGARFFDIKKKFSDQGSALPNTMAPEAQFNREAQLLGINQDSWIVVYDEQGMYSSARAWWMFKNMGHQQVAVLNGGLPGWQAAGHAVEPLQDYSGPKGNFQGTYRTGAFTDLAAVQTALETGSKPVLDARSAGRFNGTAPEPRAGLPSGHMPNSISLPYSKVAPNGFLLAPEELEQQFTGFAPKDKPLILSCGSGITACVLALGADVAGYKDLTVYDGSWTEWAEPGAGRPIETKG